MKELPKQFNFKEIDKKWTDHWVDKGLFHAQADPNKKPYTVVIPPPNVTGILHMGHALNDTLQDIIVRYKRMKGFSTCWMPGTDHAGIATQNVVERQLNKEGKNRHDIGREALVERLWDWKKEYGDTIIHQLKKIGSSCDWSRTRFTMDDGYSEAVKKVFIELYKKGLVYQGEYIINWCPRCCTALSDEESEHKEHSGTLTHIKYPLKNDPNKFLIVATTRPETMLGDTAVAVNPEDERYKDLIGQTLILPIIGREIKVIADEFVDPQFGTGAVKVTPAHDPNDFEMGKRHNLEFINILDPHGIVNENGGAYKGMDRFDARKKVVEQLKTDGYFEKVENHTHAVGHCYRCDSVVEPYLSKQWFVKMAPLAKPALDVVLNGKIKFYPEHWTKVYVSWMENIRDWCISRQIWWGHRIPVWYDEEGNIFVAHDEAEAKEQAKAKHGKEVTLKQDEDVLDTWFSSWLWPFATFGWPEKNEDLKYFYPGDALFTASEIIFFWVARMIMAGIEFMGDVPFTDVYIHGTVRDEKGRKMSKSLGNALDPLEIIDEYGADALRFSLIMNSGQDLYISKDKFETGRNFANKIWNASRLILMNSSQIDGSFKLSNIEENPASDLASRWITSKFYFCLGRVEEAIENYRYSEAENLIYEFFWNQFCDWYLEIIKNKWNDVQIQNTAYTILKESLKMMHPFIPVVTEEIHQNLNEGSQELCITPWPQMEKKLINPACEKEMQTVIDIITAIRTLRAQWNIKPNEKVSVKLSTQKEDDIKIIKDNGETIKNLCRAENLTIEQNITDLQNCATAVAGSITCIIPLADVVDLDKEKKKINEQIAQLEKNITNLQKRLENEAFTSKAPQEVIEKERVRLKEMTEKLTELKEVISSLS